MRWQQAVRITYLSLSLIWRIKIYGTNEYIQYVAKNLFYTSVGFYEENNQTEELFETVNKILIDNSEEVLSKSDFVYYLNRETEEVTGFNLTFTKTSLYK